MSKCLFSLAKVCECAFSCSLEYSLNVRKSSGITEFKLTMGTNSHISSWALSWGRPLYENYPNAFMGIVLRKRFKILVCKTWSYHRFPIEPQMWELGCVRLIHNYVEGKKKEPSENRGNLPGKHLQSLLIGVCLWSFGNFVHWFMWPSWKYSIFLTIWLISKP